MPPSGYYTGLNSLGLILFKGGASWSNFLSYYSPPLFVTNIAGSMGQLTAFGALLLVAFPIVLSAVALILPEMRNGMRHVRIRIA